MIEPEPDSSLYIEAGGVMESHMDEQSTPQEAITSLFESHSNDLYRYARYMLGNETEAYDVVQEVFLRAFRQWKTFRWDTSGKNWLFRIARNYVFDIMRKKRKERRLLSYNSKPEMLSVAETGDEVQMVENEIVLEQSLQGLKTRYRQVFVLRHIDDFSVRDTARVLGLTEGQVRMNDHRAITHLRKQLRLGNEGVNQDYEQ